ncbi:unnamed protein product [Triticum turgidum subsp. durum]|uniref:SOSEKI DIX-like domain-containing protein n=1 Tax=Triticum turgidum subsp. durum TaxID=4567 RepID=A0A9R0S4D7_TRITD|nr:unnamed protein product [Triticum turgidum subsp. durum]
MEAAGEGRKLHHHAGGGRAQMEASPERGRPAYASAVTARSAPARPMRRVQIIYYLCRSGQLEHPHFMELAQFPHQPLRLKDVMDKLTLLRGKGMPALFSWSCKRNYKNGYVWNDLSESDVIYPSDGVEYVLKGSEIFPGCSSAVAGERFQHLRVTDRSPTKPPLALPHSHKQYVDAYRDDAGEDPEDDELGYPYHRRAAAARLGGPNKPVSARTNRGHPVELPVEETSPPSSTSSDKPPPPQQAGRCDEAEPNRTGSMLLQLIACGAVTAGPAKCGGRADPRRTAWGRRRRSTSAAASSWTAAAGAPRCLLPRSNAPTRTPRRGNQLCLVMSCERSPRGSVFSRGRARRSKDEHARPWGSRLGAGVIGEGTADGRIGGEEGMMRGRCIPGRKRQPQHQK